MEHQNKVLRAGWILNFILPTVGHKPSDVPKKHAIVKTAMDFDDIDALDRL